MTIKLSFDLFASKNNREIISSNDRYNIYHKAKLTKNLRQIGFYKARNYRISHPNIHSFHKKRPCEVRVIIFIPTKREKFDPPNLYPTIKALIDGLTDAKIFTDDNHRVIKLMSFEYGGISGTKKYKIDLEIEETK